jgi:hypothetical protein
MRAWLSLLLVPLVGCTSTEPDHPPFDGPAPTVSDFAFGNLIASATIRDPQGGVTIGRTEDTYVLFTREGTLDNQRSFAREWSWIRIDDLTWRVIVPGLTQNWDVAGWQVADEDSNIQMYVCPKVGACLVVEEPV